jgi:hypothetical protein
MKVRLLDVDAVINIALGLVLALYPRPVIHWLGIPLVQQPFYASILGAVLLGIGIALLIQVRRGGNGLGLGGAVAINMCGGVCLALWLVFGHLAIPLRGQVVMWGLVVILVGLSSFEYLAHRRSPG